MKKIAASRNYRLAKKADILGAAIAALPEEYRELWEALRAEAFSEDDFNHVMLRPGNLILFNNYHSGNNAAALEIETPIQEDGSYELIGNDPYGPDSWSWIYNNNISFGK